MLYLLNVVTEAVRRRRSRQTSVVVPPAAGASSPVVLFCGCTVRPVAGWQAPHLCRVAA